MPEQALLFLLLLAHGQQYQERRRFLSSGERTVMKLNMSLKRVARPHLDMQSPRSIQNFETSAGSVERQCKSMYQCHPIPSL
jgi:hypothetical protein